METENMETYQGTELTPLTKKFLTKYCRETKEKPEDVLQRALEQLLESCLRNRSMETKQLDIEYETISLRVPKKIMDFMRSIPLNYPGPIEWLEFNIVDQIRADLEATTGEEMINWYGLGSIFETILKDERFS